jgi:hypothetical protein
MNNQLQDLNRQIRNFTKRRGFKLDQSTKLRDRCAETQGHVEAQPGKEDAGVQEKKEAPVGEAPAPVEDELERQKKGEEKGMIEVKMVAEEVEVLVDEVKVPSSPPSVFFLSSLPLPLFLPSSLPLPLFLLSPSSSFFLLSFFLPFLPKLSRTLPTPHWDSRRP